VQNLIENTGGLHRNKPSSDGGMDMSNEDLRMTTNKMLVITLHLGWQQKKLF